MGGQFLLVILKMEIPRIEIPQIKIKELKPRPVVDANDPNKWFWVYIERRQREQVEEQMS